MNDKAYEYQAYNDKIGDRRDLYKLVAKTFNIKTALYPGSFIDIGPSLFIPKVIYVDHFKGAIKYFRDLQKVYTFINEEKDYLESSEILFYGMDYQEELPIKDVDLIISQFAGFVGQATKRYLKQDGILLCNDSHGDATLAFCDDEFELVGVVISGEISTSNLDEYFKFKRQGKINVEEVREKMKGPKYKLQAANYLFKKIR
ncbi:hypothetical protein EZV73_25355 [Acidaminobacter sp. JC074]|uniref:hypothetical protein n=1 Tax=Acidaminobacter sp. JC074 TaxID=2530199 RepID=UPI001F0EB17D|nr:hypothetical protein [Acidaminobacter sp. JC074]MCH4890933.1 hypothetical protein [Acidaminobacter sp. JC074]